VPARCVLITGISTYWGRELAARLQEDPQVERIVALGAPTPRRPPDRIEWIDVDPRSAELSTVLPRLGIEAVLHNDIHQFPEPGMSARRLHDLNVVGTLQLMAACERMPELRALVVRGSAAIYGSEPAAPQFFTEGLAMRYPLRTRFQRDIGELERLFDTFARRRPEVACTMLRLQPVLGPSIQTPIMRLLRLRVIPTYLGFDPPMQFLGEEDSVAVQLAALARGVRGPVNVAAMGTIPLSAALRRLGKVPLPVPHPLWPTVMAAAARVGAPLVTEDMSRFIRYGRGVDTTRMESELRFVPRLTTEELVDSLATKEFQVA
jgi:UDP-glucose 4-epimerase